MNALLPWGVLLPSVPVDAVVQAVVGFVVGASAVYLVGNFLIEPAADWVLRRREALGDPAVRKLAQKVVGVGVYVAALWAGLTLAGLDDVVSATATVGAAGTIAAGYAAKDVIGNFVSGLFMISDPQFEVGDWVAWGEYAGVVESVSLRTTRVRTFENRTITVPNSDLANAAVTNHSNNDYVKETFSVGVGYGEDIGAASDVILEEAARLETVRETPSPSVFTAELGASAVVLRAAVWIQPPEHAAVVQTRSALAHAVKERFQKRGITMPVPHRRLVGNLDVTRVDGDDADSPSHVDTVTRPELSVSTDESAGAERTRETTADGPVEELTDAAALEAISSDIDAALPEELPEELPTGGESSPQSDAPDPPDRTRRLGVVDRAKRFLFGASAARSPQSDAPDQPDESDIARGRGVFASVAAALTPPFGRPATRSGDPSDQPDPEDAARPGRSESAVDELTDGDADLVEGVGSDEETPPGYDAPDAPDEPDADSSAAEPKPEGAVDELTDGDDDLVDGVGPNEDEQPPGYDAPDASDPPDSGADSDAGSAGRSGGADRDRDDDGLDFLDGDDDGSTRDARTGGGSASNADGAESGSDPPDSPDAPDKSDAPDPDEDDADGDAAAGDGDV
ncbi:mechanosensitive ion channel domain-containing protein [Halobaculum sp. D14]|uniref:mechanosensitive ion channel family protein n=1 Tax=Halobaculum sp. D14 TaxID=3421642 RepID=UPI003EBF30B0